MKILVINPNRKEDYLATTIIDGLKKNNFEVYYTGEGNGANNIINDKQFIEHYKDCDYIFAIWGKSIYNGVPEPKFYLIDQVNGWNKTIYIDGSEYNYTGFPNKTSDLLHPIFKSKSKCYFKRECLPKHLSEGIIPLPFAALDSYFIKEEIEKKIDVFCSYGQTDTGLRKTSVEACNELKSLGINIKTDYSNNYLHTVKQSLITIDAFGGGECNARMWQVMANKSCLFAQKYNIVFPNLIEGKHYVSWTSKEDLKEKINYYLNNKEKLYSMIYNSYDNLVKFHKTESRIKYILEKII